MFSTANKIEELLKNDKWMKKKEMVKETKALQIGRLRDIESDNEKYADFEISKSYTSSTGRHFIKGKLGDTGPKPYFDKFLNGGMPKNKSREPHGHYNH